ncbi:NAD-dependent epimerase/dehydratase family protein [Janthinobacterium aquaticum]|uniref:NAD-dependent epimerase/dehydratase family protein n=1 Tax=Janthinobacterium sp. FT58W TaxID=2654254 RepID=UPI00186B2BA0|nr:SDR family oxidoreductase [Janthinobacterium sp. FT58W]
MRILIVGGNSTLAHALVPVLSQFAEVMTAGRSGCDVRLDLNGEIDAGAIPRGIDVLINTAASFGTGDAARSMYQIEQTNVLGPLRLCQLCTTLSISHMVQISSIYAHLTAQSPFYTPYSLSKRHAEELIGLYSEQTGLALTVIRPSQFYGTGPACRKHQPFLYTIIDKVANNENVTIYGSNDARRNFIHLDDVAELTAAAIRLKITGSHDCAQLQPVRFSDIIAAAAKAFGSRSQMVFMPQQPDIADNICPADDTLFRLLRQYPRISLELGMAKEAAYRKSMQ